MQKFLITKQKRMFEASLEDKQKYKNQFIMEVGMKKLRFLSIILFLLLITIFPINTNALSKQTSYININNSGFLEIDDLDIYDITF